jgi:transcription antitermination factor NusG
MENLFGKGLSAYPSSWRPPQSQDEQIDLGGYVEIKSGPYAELHGVVTYLEREYAWVRLDGDAYDLRFRRDLLNRID